MVNIRIAILLIVLAFLCIPPTLPGQKIKFKTNGQSLSKFGKFGRLLDALNSMKTIYDIITTVGEKFMPKDETSDTSNEEEIGFYISFLVGNTTEKKTARMSISSAITWLDNYKPSNTSQCCTENLKCSKTNCNGTHFVMADTFKFEKSEVNDVPYTYNPGNEKLNTTGFVSFSRSPYSLLGIVQEKVFSYYFSSGHSNLTLGFAPDIDTSTLQSTEIIANPSYPDLYYVDLTQIKIGNSSFQIDPTTNSSKMILDTVVSTTLLETALYAIVKSELMKLGPSFRDEVTGLDVCHFTKPTWPNLTMFFPSDPPSLAGAQMVLTNRSYVVTLESSGAECAAISETQGASVIGIQAQMGRQMIFNLSSSKPMLYFSMYPSASAVLSTGILIWLLSVILYLHDNEVLQIGP